jgi:glycosyltransferase involved in cell wall biosynthesis
MSIPSLIVPILNRYDLLENLLGSINHPIENILVINNGPKYRLPMLLKRKLRNSKYFQLDLPANFGMSASWNLGIKCFPHHPYWLFASADTEWNAESLPQIARQSSTDKVLLTNDHWGCFTLGDKIVEKVGLFDEFFYPIYWEDKDYHERVMSICGPSGLAIHDEIQAKPKNTSQTVNSDSKLKSKNDSTYSSNQQYFDWKASRGFAESKPWSLQRRRDQEWL